MDPITSSALAIRAAKGLSEHASLIFAASQFLYSYWTAEKPSKPIINKKLDPNYQDKSRYDQLCSLRLRVSEQGEIPEQWRLDEQSRPTYKVEFAHNARELKMHVEALDVCSYPQKTAVIGMLQIIENIFVSLSLTKEKLINKIDHAFYEWHEYRIDGYEVMFISDLAIWLSITLPRYDVKHPETPIMIERWLNYCKDVQTHVLKYRNDEANADSPKELLSILILEMEKLYKNVCKSQRAASFNEKLEQISNDLINIGKYVFSLQHLLIQNTSQNGVISSTGINVIQFLSHRLPNKRTKIDKNITLLVNSILGGWLAEILMFSGIESSNFINEVPIRIECITNLLNTDFSRIKNLKMSGMWTFALSNRIRAEEYLRDIAQIYRVLLMVYYVRDNVVLSSLVSRELGNAWIYGEDTGREIVEDLLKVIEHSLDQLSDTTVKFWKKFYEEDYLLNHNQTDNRDICFKHLVEANAIVQKLKSQHNSTIMKIQSIRASIAQSNQDKESIIKKVENLKQNIDTYCVHANFQVPAKLQNANLSLGTQPVVLERFQYVSLDSTFSVDNEILIKYPFHLLKIYNQSLRLYESYKNGEIKETLLARKIKENEFRTKYLRLLYSQIIRPYQGIVTGWALLSFWYGISHNKLEEFKKLYFFICSIMNLLFPLDENQKVQISQFELGLIDAFLNDVITQVFDEHQFFLLTLAFCHQLRFEFDQKNHSVMVRLSKDWDEFMVEIGHQVLKTEFENLLNAAEQSKSLTTVIEGLEKTIETLKGECDELTQQLNMKDKIISEKEQIIAEQAKTIDDYRHTNAEQAKTIDDYRHTNAEQAKTIDDYRHTNAEQAKIINHSQKRINDLNHSLDVVSRNLSTKEKKQSSKNDDRKPHGKSFSFGIFSNSNSSTSAMNPDDIQLSVKGSV